MVQKSEVLRDKKIVMRNRLRVLNETQKIAVLIRLNLSTFTKHKPQLLNTR